MEREADDRVETGETGATGQTGERGDSGQRGVGGERGPKGDHGQHGEEGKEGKRGEIGKTGPPGGPAVWVIGCTLISLLCAFVVVFGGAITLKNRSEVLDQHEVSQQIQQERADSIRRACTAQNARHDKTIKKLDQLLAAQKKDPRVSEARKEESARNRTGTVALLEALQPHQNCEKLVKGAVDTGATSSQQTPNP